MADTPIERDEGQQNAYTSLDAPQWQGGSQPTSPLTSEPSVGQGTARDYFKYRKYFLYVLVGGVVVSAIISVVAILIGKFDDTIARALWTTLLTVVHAAIALAFMSVTTSHKRDAGDELTLNTLYGITIASYFTSVLAVWRVIDGAVTGDFYQLYFNTFIVALVLQLTMKIRVISLAAGRLKQALIGTIALLWAYLIPSVFDNGTPKVLPGIYYRGIAAFIVIIGTIAVLMTIFHRLYMTKHPELKAVSQTSRTPAWVWVIIVISLFFAIPFVVGLLYALIRLFSGGGD